MIMSKEDKIKFIEDATNNLKESMIKNIDKIPEDWNGRELRFYLKDKADEFIWDDMKKTKKYKNDILIYNL